MSSGAPALTPGDVPRFDVVEAVTPVGTAPCAECRTPVVDTYYEWDGKVICAKCHPRIAASVAAPRRGGVARALGLGLVAAAVGGAVYFALGALTKHDATVALILVGVAIGKAVRVGSGGRGGRRYQWMAACLTYATIASTYVPFVTSGFGDRAPATASAAALTVTPAAASSTGAPAVTGESPVTVPDARTAATPIPATRPTAAHFAALLLLAAAAPVLAGFGNFLNIAVTIVAVLIAWRMNRPTAGTIAGPFRISASR